MQFAEHAAHNVLIHKGVACVHENAVFALCTGNALVHRIINSAVGFACPMGQLRTVLFDEFKRTVLRTAVYDDVFQGAVVLADDALDGSLQRLTCVESHGDDRYLDILAHGCVLVCRVENGGASLLVSLQRLAVGFLRLACRLFPCE